jgi:hypothetical protein
MATCWAGDPELFRKGQEFQALRKERGHFSGGESWNARVDAWNGRKHQLMGELMKVLETGQSEETLVNLLGKPDELDESSWVYYWRGKHDYLIFDLKDGFTTGARWWMAGE